MALSVITLKKTQNQNDKSELGNKSPTKIAFVLLPEATYECWVVGEKLLSCGFYLLNEDVCEHMGFMCFSVMRITVFHKAVCDVVGLQQLLVIIFLHFCVDGPGDNLHPPLGPVLHVVR